MQFNQRKGIGISDLGPLAIAFVVITIIIAFGGQMLGEIQSTQTADTTEYNVTGQGLTGITTFGNFLPLIAIVIIIVVIVALLVRNLGGVAG